MKKFLVAALVIAMVSMIGLVAFAKPYNAADKKVISAEVDVKNGTVQLTYDLASIGAQAIWTELTVTTEKPELKTDGTDEFNDFYGSEKGTLMRLDLKDPENGGDNSNNTCTGGALLAPKGTKDANYYYDFEEGKTYYFVLAWFDGAWNYCTQACEVKFVEGEAPAPTADVSTIAFAVASVLGCGALAVRKKR